ncbi:MAG: hemophore-related protein [Mycobacterium sp.]
MTASALLARRITLAALGAGAVLIAGAGTVAAAPAPGCTVADITAVESGVAAGLTAYLFSHPDVNDSLSSFQGLPKAEATSRTRAYLAANPQVQADINGIRGPVFDLRARCNIPTNNLIRGVL